MSLLATLPFNLAVPGPPGVAGIGNYHLSIYPHTSSPIPDTAFATLFFLDSHSGIPSNTSNPDYAPINQSQIEWFRNVSQHLDQGSSPSTIDDSSTNDGGNNDSSHPSTHTKLVFQHIPLSEFSHPSLEIHGGERHEPTEGPSMNTHFYDALVEEGVVAMGVGHDHVNDFCGILPPSSASLELQSRVGQEQVQVGGEYGDAGRAGQAALQDRSGGRKNITPPWLCHAGAAGFGGYGSYDGVRYYRRMRMWEMDAGTGSVRTWKRVEYQEDRVDEMVLAEGGENG
jgi:hypothetical protein